MPDWFTTWEETGLLSFNDKNKDGKIQYVEDASINELTIDKDIMVLANPEIAQLPNWVIALSCGRSSCGGFVYCSRIVVGNICLSIS